MKRRSTVQATHITSSKKLRYKLPRRRRSILSPIILLGFAKPPASSSRSTSLVISMNSTCFDEELSCKNNNNNNNVAARTRCSVSGIQDGNDGYRRVMRSQSKRRGNAFSKAINDGDLEISENSCVELCSVEIKAETELHSKGNGGAVVRESEQVPARSVESPGKLLQISAVEENESAAISDNCGCECEHQFSEIMGICTNVNLSNSASSTIEHATGRFVVANIDLACPEQFPVDSDEDDLEVSSASFSELQSEFIACDSEDYTPSLRLDTGSQFSEKSVGDSTPSLCFSVFKKFSQQLSKRNPGCDHDASSHDEEEYSDEETFWKFEDEEEEECYRRLRSRERKHVVELIDDYTTEYGTMILDQRKLMVDWIIETTHRKELHDETMFLGVHLLDRSLSKACFKNRRKSSCLGYLLHVGHQNRREAAIQQHPSKDILCGEQYLQQIRSCGDGMGGAGGTQVQMSPANLVQLHGNSQLKYEILRFYLNAANADEGMKQTVKYLAELALRDNRQLRFWPSTVAAGLVILVSLAANRQISCEHVMEAHIRTKVDDFPECLKSLEWLVKYAC